MNGMTATLRSLAMILALAFTLDVTAQVRAQPLHAMAVAGTGTVPTTNFVGQTLEQVQAEAVVPAKTKDGRAVPMFSSIYPSTSQGGVVVSQSPKANTPVYPGQVPLTLTLQTPKAPSSSTWTQILQGLVNSQPPPVPSVIVPAVMNDTCEKASEAIKAARLSPSCSGTGIVVQEDPVAGTKTSVNSRVTVILRYPLIVVPSLRGNTLDSAQQVLGALNLQLSPVAGSVAGSTSSRIVSQVPVAGTSVSAGSTVDVTLQAARTQPPPQTTVVVPYLQKLNQAEAVSILQRVGLQLGNPSADSEGIVTGQSPTAGTEVAEDSAVNITLTSPVAQVKVPDVLKKSLADASSELEATALNGVPSYPQASADQVSMIVMEQRPVAGTAVNAGASVELIMGTASSSTPVTQSTQPVPSGTSTDTTTSAQPVQPAQPQQPLPWTWIAIAGAAGLIGIAAGPRMWHHFFPEAVVTTVPHANPARAAVSCTNPPAIRFTITLRDRPVTATYRSNREAGIARKGRSS